VNTAVSWPASWDPEIPVTARFDLSVDTPTSLDLLEKMV